MTQKIIISPGLRASHRLAIVIGLLAIATGARAQDSLMVNGSDSIAIHFVDVDLRAAVQALSRYLDRPVIVGNVTTARITFETPRPVPRSEIPRLLRGLLESQGMRLVSDSASGVYRLENRESERPLQEAPQQRLAANSGQPLELFAIRLKHAKAADVAATVNALYGRASALGELGAHPATLARGLQSQQVPLATSNSPGATSLPTEIALNGNATLMGEVVIVPDARANSLLVRASRADFELVQAAVRQIDVRPLQVLIEVMIAELRRDRSFQFGVSASLPATKVKGTDNMTIGASTGGAGVGDFVLKVMGIGGVDIEATLSAAASRGDARIISRPVLLAANNEPAEINVGSQRPFVQVSRVLPTDNTARDQVVQYKDVGTRLHVIPTISDDDYVMLQVTQEVNAATAEQAFDAPVISTRSVETRLLVRDGQTIVLGGLSDTQRDASQGGVPFLSNIPLLGGLFGHAQRQTTETELYLFLRPRIIRNDDDVDALTDPLRRKARRIERE
jgi:general secretion pathway protein D